MGRVAVLVVVVVEDACRAVVVSVRQEPESTTIAVIGR